MAEAAPRPGEEPAHDVLAAEAFAVPAPDPDLRHPSVLPDDPSGIPEAHDILAAEEFAMPALNHGEWSPVSAQRAPRWGSAVAIAAGLLGAMLIRRRRGDRN